MSKASLASDFAKLSVRAIRANLARGPRASVSAEQAQSWLQEVRRTGLCVVEGFYDAAQCAQLRAEIDRLIETYPQAVHHKSGGADLRIFGAETASEAIRQFSDDPVLLESAGAMLGRGARPAVTLAARIQATQSNIGSGDGWHRDSFFDQFKAIVYLSDVEPENGPFQYVLGSHTFGSKITDAASAGISAATTRVDDAQAEALIAAAPERNRIVTGPAGSLVLADTSGIHRGMPLEAGSRYALTNYYFGDHHITDGLLDHFKPVLGRDVPVV